MASPWLERGEREDNPPISGKYRNLESVLLAVLLLIIAIGFLTPTCIILLSQYIENIKNITTNSFEQPKNNVDIPDMIKMNYEADSENMEALANKIVTHPSSDDTWGDKPKYHKTIKTRGKRQLSDDFYPTSHTPKILPVYEPLQYRIQLSPFYVYPKQYQRFEAPLLIRPKKYNKRRDPDLTVRPIRFNNLRNWTNHRQESIQKSFNITSNL